MALTKPAEKLLAAAKMFGDARAHEERNLYAWKHGSDRSELEVSSRATQEASYALESAARAYATSVRKRAPKATPT
jgi:hypothetical protein